MLLAMTTLPAQRPKTYLTTPPRVGLALGGGGARGLAHILVLEVFDELGITPHRIAGTSIGAIFGAVRASGLSAAQIRERSEETLTNRLELVRQLFSGGTSSIRRLRSILPMRSALLEPRALLDLVLPQSLPATFEELEIPLSVVACDVGHRETVVFEHGDIRTAIAASIAIPVVFSPVSYGERTLADGGLVNPLPYDLLRKDCDIIVAIDVSGAASEAAIGPKPGAFTMLAQSVQIMQKRLIRERLRYDQPDIYIDVQLDRFAAFQFHKIREILDAAQPAKQELATKLRRILASTPAALSRPG
jgi:NTE family protein